MPKQSTTNIVPVLSFDRKIDPSDAIFTSCRFDEQLDHEPIPVREKTVRGVISNIAKMTSASVESTNIQTIDVAQLPHGADALQARFSLRVLGGVGVPFACSSVEYQNRLEAMMDESLAESLQALASRYAANIANARFLWRNRLAAETVIVRVVQTQDGDPINLWEFQSKAHSVSSFQHMQEREGLASAIYSGLSDGYTLFVVSAYARMGPGQQVFPSEEMIMEKGKGSKKSKTLYSVDGVAAMHSQKIGNALRTVDDWYPRDQGDFGPIAVEPFGQITARGLALRQPKQKADFYTLLDQWAGGDDIGAESRHFVIANMIRGGVFGRSGK